MAAISILLVEDDRSTAYLIEHILVSANFAVDVVSTASAALRRLARRMVAPGDLLHNPPTTMGSGFAAARRTGMTMIGDVACR